MPYNMYQAYPYFQPYQPAVQPQAMQTPQQLQAVQPVQAAQSGIIWVSGEQEASMYPIAPNSAVTLWSQSEAVVYLKQADASGKPTMRTYELVERTGAPAPGQDYATKADLDSMSETIAAMRRDIDALYSRRRAARKEDGADE